MLWGSESPANVDLEPGASLSLTTSGSVGQQAAPAARGTRKGFEEDGQSGRAEVAWAGA